MHLKKVLFLSDRFPNTTFYPFNQPVFQKTGQIPFESPVTFLVGENGTGKSTLLRAMCHRCGIHIWQDEEGMRFEINPYEKQFYRFISVEWDNGSVPGSFFASEFHRDFAGYLDEWAVADP